MDYDNLGDLPSYLGVQITKHADGSLELGQPHLMQSIISALGLSDSRPKATPATRTYGKCEDSPPLNAEYNYQSVVGMLMYLGNNSRPDLAFAIHQCARFSANPRAPHGEALKQIGRYLQATPTKGLILKPTKRLNLDCYVDADFAGIWGNEDAQDTACVRSRTGFIITLGGCPITWSSKLQTKVALSTMEAEYIAASTAMRTLIPLRQQLITICNWLNLSKPTKATVSIVWEDNQAALQLSNKNPQRMTPRSKHIAIKYHWFRSKLEAGVIEMKHIDTNEQLGDIFTKPLTPDKFATARKKFMGW
ncbi:hypothetical protein ACA910_018970 [Epithemia clementina (nom. ined.)]